MLLQQELRNNKEKKINFLTNLNSLQKDPKMYVFCWPSLISIYWETITKICHQLQSSCYRLVLKFSLKPKSLKVSKIQLYTKFQCMYQCRRKFRCVQNYRFLKVRWSQNVFMKSSIPPKKFDRFLPWKFIQTRYVMHSPE